MTTCSRFVRQGVLGLVVSGMVVTAMPAPASAQVAVGAGVDFPSLYYFRGVRQEADPKFTMQPWVDVGGTLRESDGSLKGITANVGLWNSWHTGSSGTGEFPDGTEGPGLFYETDFYATVNLGFGGFALATTYTVYMYPDPDFDTIHEIAFKGTFANMLSPYALLAIEMDDCEGCPKGTYLELGVAPSFPLTDQEGGPTLGVPVKLAFDVDEYYGIDESGFGFFSAGGVVTYPMGALGGGSWSIRGGLDLLFLSDVLESYNAKEDGDTSSVGFVGFGGISFSF
jgi:hypothetical protein